MIREQFGDSLYKLRMIREQFGGRKIASLAREEHSPHGCGIQQALHSGDIRDFA
jgi:hypothetical protein